MKRRAPGACLMVLFGLLLPASAAADESDPVLSTLNSELNRQLEALQAGDQPPYWMALQVTQEDVVRVVAEDGSLSARTRARTRYLDVDVRLGSERFDNTRDAMGGFSQGRPFPVDDDPGAMALTIWAEVAAAHGEAVRSWAGLQSSQLITLDDPTQVGDFSPADPLTHLEPLDPLGEPEAAWQEALIEASARFGATDFIHDGVISLEGRVETRWLVTSDGVQVRQTLPLWRASMLAQTVAADGMPLELFDSLDGHDEASLGAPAQLVGKAEALVERLAALRVAAPAEPWSGPAMLSGHAAGVFFHEIFGHRVEGHRQKGRSEARTFADMVGQPVLPEWLDVYDDATLAQWGETPLRGYYRVDDEGVPVGRVELVEDGQLSGFLLSRSPIPGFPRSNGHGRREPGHPVVARQGNLIAESESGLAESELEQRFLAAIEASGAPYGLFFERVSGGYTMTDSWSPNSFNVSPTVVWKVFPDGRRELTRGVDLIGTPLTAFSQILAVGDPSTNEVFNGTCGAESGWVPVSAVAPPLILEQLEVQRRGQTDAIPPILPPPSLQEDAAAAHASVAQEAR